MPIDHSHLPEELPELSRQYPVDSSQVEQFQNNGHLMVRQVVERSVVQAYSAYIDDAVQQFRSTEAKSTHLDLMNLWGNSAAVRQFVTSRRFAGIAAKLLGVRAVRLYLDQAFYKPPERDGIPWHQVNSFLLRLEPFETVTMWMPLIDISPGMGSITYVTGGHRIESIRGADNILLGAVRRGGFSHTYGTMQAGDATFHSGWTPLMVPDNGTDLSRKVMSVIYFPADARVMDPDDVHHLRPHLRRLFQGLQAGDIANPIFNPVVYDEELELC
jgi:hypothetical protein